MRLQSFLSKAGVASRRAVVAELEAGRVKVNGQVVRLPSHPVDPAKDEITYEGKRIQFGEFRYFIFYKPKGVITTVTDTHDRKTVMDFFSHVKDRIYPVGRLDQDTTGLLLLTNDGDLANHLTHPRYGVEKIYEAKLNQKISSRQIRELEAGVMLDGEMTRPCEIHPDPTRVNQVEVRLKEGRKRQVRMMFETIGIRVIDLHRKKYGPLTLKGLKRGELRELTDLELAALRDLTSSKTQTPRDLPRGPLPRARKSV